MTEQETEKLYLYLDQIIHNQSHLQARLEGMQLLILTKFSDKFESLEWNLNNQKK